MKRIPNDEILYYLSKEFLINAKGNEIECENGEKCKKNNDAHWCDDTCIDHLYGKKKSGKFFFPIFFFFLEQVDHTVRHKIKKKSYERVKRNIRDKN